jgi:hypothetical protein
MVPFSMKGAMPKSCHSWQYVLHIRSCVVNPDPVGSETFNRIRIRKNHSGSEQLRIRNEFEVNYSENVVKNLTISQQKCTI